MRRISYEKKKNPNGKKKKKNARQREEVYLKNLW